MPKLGAVDTTFLYMETTRTPMHIGVLLTFHLPHDAPAGFPRELLAKMRRKVLLPPPMDCAIVGPSLRHPVPVWVPVHYDPEYHVRHSALPQPGSERELGELVARLHSYPLDLRHPPWECHLIEGLEGHRFAIYFKVHHSAADGMAMLKLLHRWLSADPHDPRDPFADLSTPPADAHAARVLNTRERWAVQREKARKQLRAVPLLAKALWEMSKGGRGSGMRAPFETPRSILNVPISQHRRLGTQVLSLARVKAVARATDCSINDVVIALCGGALRRYLIEHKALPRHTLLASVPVGLARAEGTTGNVVAGFVCPLGTRTADPAQRLREVHRVTALSKTEINTLTPAAATQLTLMGLSPLILGQITGTLPKLPLLFNVTISNLVVSKVPLYLFGAELEAMYPMSILFDGYALNITLVGYADSIAVGFTGCRDALPHLQRLAVYLGEALPELESALGIGHRARRRKTPTAHGGPRKPTTRAKATPR
ncbi:MAG: wax ester/triacylglycerol synthase family O-acyltransferase [Nevskiaceae bacterium]|nr:MAG: wax ester/triacylglycerol synthase family O-acyltransferase [Nevskiaceae bacterium]TBR73692.1 MAG: wax ester/triacylglycerol synthase family O-acyltransferase [Nevskiaceae bacterium]